MSVSIPAVTSFKYLIYTHTYMYKIQCNSHVILALSQWGFCICPFVTSVITTPASGTCVQKGHAWFLKHTWICSFCFALHYTQVEKWETTLKLLLLGMSHKCTLPTQTVVPLFLWESHFFILQQRTFQQGVPMPRHGYLLAEDHPSRNHKYHLLQVPSQNSLPDAYSILS